MKIGLSTAILWDYEKLDLSDAVFHAADLGFEAVEIHCEDPFFQGWGTDEAEITESEVKDALATLDMEVSLHAPFHDLNIATLNTGINGEVLRQLEECIDTARRLGSEIVVVHPGFVSSRKFKREKPFQRMVENLEKIAETAEDAAVKICLENLASKRKAMGVKIRELKDILKEVDAENLKITLDVAHANTTEAGPVKFAEEFKEDIAHVHVSDNTGEDNHLSIGQGNIDFENVLKELHPFDGVVMVEGWIPTDEDPFLVHDREELERVRGKLTG
ncbi:hypothetical protein AKJ39_04790 [candidate division MSBL1 archaeon SCGC-AAA259J03]|uniref:Xylose isomerase-like TIM barrel domain-containing protein n=1 Tax=candidate division MSBL1 archaeon SCGC-AAA259J03 TaxID=1698269 RepID=A0A656YUL3_9EURY|nr:hypothetical protein AKJ39_04790 [candidate division MSBL1 archaeon SCGC-AAA259J03]